MKLQVFTSSYFCGKSHSEDDGSQNYLAFNHFIDILKRMLIVMIILAWKFKGLSDKSIKPPAAFNNSLAPGLNHINTELRVKFVV